MTTLEFARKMAAVPLAFQPRSHYRYGSSADILGAVIEVCSQMRFGEFLKKEFFEPLEMNDTAFWVPKDKLFLNLTAAFIICIIFSCFPAADL